MALLLARVAGASAASKEQQQLMAELRMMQEQQQQLAADAGALADTLKTVTGRLDDQAATPAGRRSPISGCWSRA